MMRIPLVVRKGLRIEKLICFPHTKNLKLSTSRAIIHLGQVRVRHHYHFHTVRIFMKINTEGGILRCSLQDIYIANYLAFEVQNNCVTWDIRWPIPALLNG